MKKMFGCLLAIILFTVFTASPAVFAGNIDPSDAESVMALIEKTNGEIDDLIEQAAAEADKLEKKYTEDTNKTQKEAESLELEIEVLNSELSDADLKEYEKIANKIEKLTDKRSKESEKLARIQDKFDRELDELIESLLTITNEMSAETIAKAAEKGVIVECTWVLVELGGRMVWVDPLKVVGP